MSEVGDQVGGPDPAGVPRSTVPLAAPPPPPPPLPEATDVDPGAGLAVLTDQRRPGQVRPSTLDGVRAGLSRFLSRFGRSKRELLDRRDGWTRLARLPLDRPVVYVVASPKGGVGKTTIADGLGEELAGLRAERVAIVDAEPLGGTLGLRVAAMPGLGVPALIENLDAVEQDGSYTAWARYATVEHRTRVTVFGRMEPFAGAELHIDPYRRIIAGLSRQWPIVVVDTGRPEGRDVLQAAAVTSADVLIVVCGPGRPTIDAVAGWLREVRVPPGRRVGAVVARTGGDPAEAQALLQAHCSAVVHIPVDSALDADAPVPLLGGARPATRDAFLALAAAVMRASQQPRGQEDL